MNLLGGYEHGPGQPVVIAICGAPGSGKTTLAAHIGRFLLRKGKRVLLVDADTVQPRLEILLGLDGARPDRQNVAMESVALASLIVEGSVVDNLPVLPLGIAIKQAFRGQTYRGGTLIARLRALSFDYVLVDLPGTPGPAASSVLALADVPIVVSTVETASLVSVAQILRWALVYGMLNHPDARRMGEQLVDRVGALHSSDGIDEILVAFDGSPAAAILDSVLARLETYLIVNQAREPAEREVGQTMALGWYRSIGLRPRVLGAVDFDDRRWFYERQGAFMTPLGSGDGAGANIEEIGKRIIALNTLDLAQPRIPYGVPLDATELLGLSKRADPLALRQGYRQLWEGLRRESCVTRTIYTRAGRARLLEDLEQANRELQTWLAERVDTIEPPSVRLKGGSPGEPIREARQAMGLSLRELSLRTKIGLRYVEAIEGFEVDHLPRTAYLRGYLREIARMLQLDPIPLLDGYLSALSEARTRKILRH